MSDAHPTEIAGASQAITTVVCTSDLYTDLSSISTPATLVIECVYPVAGTSNPSGPVVVPEYVTVRFRGGNLVVDHDVEINGAIEAPSTSVIFDVSSKAADLTMNWTGKLYANWWSESRGGIGEQWENMRASLPADFTGDEDPRCLAVAGNHVISKSLDCTNMRSDVWLDFSEAIFRSVVSECDGTPVPTIDLSNSRFYHVVGLRLFGGANASLGVLQSRWDPEDKEKVGQSSGGSLHNCHIFGEWSYAALVNIEAENCCYTDCYFTAGNKEFASKYTVLLSRDNPADIKSIGKPPVHNKYVKLVGEPTTAIEDDSSFKSAYFYHCTFRGNTTDGGLYIRGASDISVFGGFFRHGSSETTPAAHIVLDTSGRGGTTINDFLLFEAIFEGFGPSLENRPVTALKTIGGTAVKNSVIHLRDSGASSHVCEIDTQLENCDFRINSADTFEVKNDRSVRSCRIWFNTEEQGMVKLPGLFTGELRVGGGLATFPDRMRGRIEDLDAAQWSFYSDQNNPMLVLDNARDDSAPPQIWFRKQRGTHRSPAEVDPGDYAQLTTASAYVNARMQSLAQDGVVYEGNGNQRRAYRIWTLADDGAPQERMRLTRKGDLEIGGGLDAGGNVAVDGDVRIAGSLGVGNAQAITGTFGSVTHKIKVFDENGSFIGFLPVYDSIS